VKIEGEYLELLIEARKLYVEGYFYSCVAMCGIVAEDSLKIMRESASFPLKCAPSYASSL
jgi:hypothetical protein